MRKIILQSLSVLILITVFSCNKDEDFQDHKYGIKDPGSSPVGLGFPQAANKINTISINNVDAAQTFQIALVNVLSDEPATEDLHITLEELPSMIPAYNAEYDPDLTLLPANAYSIPNMTVVIPKGQRTATLTFTIPDAMHRLDITKGYGLGLQIKSVKESGITIASNMKKILIGIAIKNEFDGIYSLKGYTLRSGDLVKTGNFSGYQMSLITTGVSSVGFSRIQYWADGIGVDIGTPQLAINPATNKVTITSSGGASNFPGYDSRYDPTTRTFYIAFTWGAGPAARAAIDTLTYSRPR